MKRRLISVFALALVVASTGCRSTPDPQPASEVRSVAMRVHDLEAMVAFYQEAFGVRFEEVETFAVRSQFGQLGRVTLKLVPLRTQADFDGYANLQLGVTVDSIERVVAAALEHGGRAEGEIVVTDGRRHGAVRDPDGNTIELYEGAAAHAPD